MAKARSVRRLSSPEEDTKLEHHFVVKEPIPICVTVCEPICVDSKYRIGFEFLRIPIGSIGIAGRTRISKCSDTDREEPGKYPAKSDYAMEEVY
jgi:hypothetical protein